VSPLARRSELCTRAGASVRGSQFRLVSGRANRGRIRPTGNELGQSALHGGRACRSGLGDRRMGRYVFVANSQVALRGQLRKLLRPVPSRCDRLPLAPAPWEVLARCHGQPTSRRRCIMSPISTIVPKTRGRINRCLLIDFLLLHARRANPEVSLRPHIPPHGRV
jgi:hypothetical protein